MTSAIIITFCTLILIAYAFDLTASRTRIPSVILLLLLGWGVKQLTVFLGIHLPETATVLPVIGTVGLILIVLEGSMGLELNPSKLGMIRRSFLGALLSMLALGFLISYLFYYFGEFSFKDSLTSVLPLCVVSSAIAIPSVRNLAAASREFVIYESSFSDILGVLVFNFVAFNEVIDGWAFGNFGLELGIIAIVSFIATIGLSILLNRIEHEVKFVPIILLVILIYAVSKYFHLPGLIFIMLFGLFIGNVSIMRRFRWIERLRPEELGKQVLKFRELANEGAFLVRALFFLLFGYSIETSDVINLDSLQWAVVIVFFIYSFRAIQLRLSGLPRSPLMFVAPRGLITILLFMSIDPSHIIPLVNKSLIIQVILLTAVVMMIGMVTAKAELPGEPVSK